MHVPRGHYESLPETTRQLLRGHGVDRLAAKLETYVDFEY